MELVEIFNKAFNRNITLTQIRNYKKHRKLKSNKFGNQELFSEKEKKYFIENIKGKSAKEFQQKFNKKFNKNITVEQIMWYKKNHNIRSEMLFNFKKGHIPQNYQKIGVEKNRLINNKHITYIKINKHNWVNKARYLYEKQNGKLNNNEIIIFADGDSSNYDINNLIKLNREEFSTMYQQKLLFDNEELTKTGILTAKLIIKTKEKEGEI